MPAAFAKHVPRYRPAPRPSAAKRGYDAAWQRESKAFLQLHPWCAICARLGLRVASTCVDHLIAHKGNRRLFRDQSNWQPCCKSHNSQKCATSEGGFGREPK